MKRSALDKLAFLVFFHCIAGVDPLQAQILKVPYVSISPTNGPLWIAKETDLFKKHNIEAQLIYIPGGTVIIQSMLAGEARSEEHTSELQSLRHLVCRLLLEKKNKIQQ